MQILRLPDVCKKTGLRRSALYQRIAAGSFPRPVPLGPKARGFIEAEVDHWIAARVRERDARAA